MAGRVRPEELRLVRPGDELNLPAHRDHRTLAIAVENATLHYPIGPLVKGSLKTNLFRLFGHRETTLRPTYIDAVHGLDLDVGYGERVALIGRNGSGKSSLLRALAGIYPLKSGSVRVVGQIGALLDISLGFEAESTGRENIYHRGMAMGFSPRQLRAVEQEIIEFAALGDFIDLPVRTYSAGMYVRLGFAISTQFSPDILLVDEVFGAGDADFAHRAIARMMSIVERAGIMVLATHDLALVNSICNRVVWLDQGAVMRDGPPQVVIPQYLQYIKGDPALV
jgi:lipopolysaccharide transport system ATP-binding protein